ncbi:hypothetical protein AAY473_006517, partial [Plecturocebus cupreus]
MVTAMQLEAGEDSSKPDPGEEAPSSSIVMEISSLQRPRCLSIHHWLSVNVPDPADPQPESQHGDVFENDGPERSSENGLEQESRSITRLECSGVIPAHCNFRFPGSSYSSASASETGFHHIGQAGLELLTSDDPPASASQTAGITGVSHRSRPKRNFYTGEIQLKPTNVFQVLFPLASPKLGAVEATKVRPNALKEPGENTRQLHSPGLLAAAQRLTTLLLFPMGISNLGSYPGT